MMLVITISPSTTVTLASSTMGAIHVSPRHPCEAVTSFVSGSQATSSATTVMTRVEAAGSFGSNPGMRSYV